MIGERAALAAPRDAKPFVNAEDEEIEKMMRIEVNIHAPGRPGAAAIAGTDCAILEAGDTLGS